MSYLFTCRSGSVYAFVQLVFGKSVTEPLKPLQDEIRDGKLGSLIVSRELDRLPTGTRFFSFFFCRGC